MKAKATMLLKTQKENIPSEAKATIFMKIRDLYFQSHDIHEKTGTWSKRGVEHASTMQH
jgi:hypothetical protein